MFGSRDFPTLKLISAVNCSEFAGSTTNNRNKIIAASGRVALDRRQFGHMVTLIII